MFKIKVDREKLHRAVSRVGNLTNNRAILPLLSNCLIESCDNGKIKLTTTDLELRMSTSIDAEIEKEGKTTVPARKLGSLVSAISGAQLEVAADEKDHVSIKCGNGNYTLLGLSAKDFPEMETSEFTRKIVIKENILRKMICAISYAVSADDSRKVLTGVLFSLRGTNLVLVATDGKRMAIQNGSPESIEGGDIDVIVPLRAVNELRRVAENDSNMEIRISEKFCSFVGENFELSTKLIEGNYPDYMRVMPKSFEKEVEIPADLFKSKLQTVSLLLPDTNSCVILNLIGDKMKISASSTEVGSGEDYIDINYGKEDFEISFNPQFLIEPLNVTEKETITLKLNDPLNPVVMESDEGFSYVIMPIRKK